MKIDTRDNLQIIRDQLDSLHGRRKVAGDWYMIPCPMPDHPDKDPSFGIYLQQGGKYPLGFCRCLGCGAKGRWNEIAEKINWPKINEWNDKESEARNAATKEVEEELLGTRDLSLTEVLKYMRHEEASPWPEAMDWRSYKGAFVRKLGGLIIEDGYKDTVAVLFPIYIGSELKGAVKALHEKNEKGSSYFTMKGEWVTKYGLFPYNISAKKAARKGYVILVEGPRDAMRLIKLGMPAMAVLGAGTMTRHKAQLIKALGVTVYAMPDNDKGGITLWRSIKEELSDVHPKRFKLPRTYGSDGKLIKVDPGNASIKLLREIRTYLTEKHG